MHTANLGCVVSIAGTDPSGGAGIQADTKVISATGCYAASVITCLVAQNTQGVQTIYPISAEFVAQQIDSVFTDLHVDAVKIGMLHDASIIRVVSEALAKYQPKFVVLDPVMVAQSGCPLMGNDMVGELKHSLLKQPTLITPNIPEAEYLLNTTITNKNEMLEASSALGEQFQVNVLLKGGHVYSSNKASDVLYSFENATHQWFHSDMILTKNTHGTGCSLSSAIASYLAQKLPLAQAILKAKLYLSKAIRSGSRFTIGQGHGPVDHFFFLESRKDYL